MEECVQKGRKRYCASIAMINLYDETTSMSMQIWIQQLIIRIIFNFNLRFFQWKEEIFQNVEL